MLKIIIILILFNPTLCLAGWSAELEETGATPALHAVACGISSHLLVKNDFKRWQAFAIPVTIGTIKEFAIDENIGWDDMAGNVIGSVIGTWVTPNLRFSYHDKRYGIQYLMEF